LKSDTPCAHCGETYPPCVMDYDHQVPSEKKHNVAHMMGQSWQAILKEIDKCVLLCANCHRIKTHIGDIHE